jgi:hypothetical protein
LSTPATNSVYAELRKELNSYQDTVNFLLALIHELSWDDSTRAIRADVTHEHGSRQNAPGNKDAVTPDLAMLLGQSDGIVGDVKIAFARTDERRRSITAQLLKYDRVVSAWLTPRKASKPRASRGCTVLLTHHTRKVDAAEYLEQERQGGRFNPRNAFAIVAAVRAPQGNTEEFINLEKSYGTLVPPEKDRKLARVVPVRLDHLTTRYAVKFYDAQPPVAYLLQLIWDNILPTLTPEESFRPDVQPERPSIETTAAEVARHLRDSYSMRLLNPALPESPTVKSVSAALDLLVGFKLGNKLGVDGNFRFQYRRLRGGSLEYFLRKQAAVNPAGKRRTRSKKQLLLFDPKAESISKLDNDRS